MWQGRSTHIKVAIRDLAWWEWRTMVCSSDSHTSVWLQMGVRAPVINTLHVSLWVKDSKYVFYSFFFHYWPNLFLSSPLCSSWIPLLILYHASTLTTEKAGELRAICNHLHSFIWALPPVVTGKSLFHMAKTVPVCLHNFKMSQFPHLYLTKYPMLNCSSETTERCEFYVLL